MNQSGRLRTALVTGGNRGIGIEVCRGLGRLGYRVVLAGRNQEAAEAAASMLRQDGAQVVARLLDVTDSNSIRDLPDAVEKEFGGADVLVNNAAILLSEEEDVLSVPVDPGWVRTDMGGPSAPRSVEQGADTIVWCATLPDGGPTDGFFHDRQAIAW